MSGEFTILPVNRFTGLRVDKLTDSFATIFANGTEVLHISSEKNKQNNNEKNIYLNSTTTDSLPNSY